MNCKYVGWRRLLTIASAVLVWAAAVHPAHTQQRELTAGDRLALLYSPQLNFTSQGDPVIRVGILEGKKKVEFTPSESIRVMPQGEGGAEVVLPGDRTYTVAISESKPGRYKHWVVVDGLPVAQREEADGVSKQWTQRGYLPETFEVGGLFAIRGEVFDSRRILVAVGGTGDLDKANRLKRKLEAKFGIIGRIHSEVTKYPSGVLTLTGEGVEATVRHPSVMWVSSESGREEKIRYSIPGVEKSYGAGTETRTYLGTLIFAPDKEGRLVAMTSLGAERLLRGVVPSEIYASAPQQALRAQAVAARNEIFGAIGVRNLADPFMQRADVYDQVYKGVGVEDARTTRAIKATRGKVMFYGKQIVEAVYSSNAGGFTEDNDNVWDAEARPYLRGRPDAPDADVPEAFKDGISEDKLEAFLDSDMPAHSREAPVSSTKFYRWTRSVSASEPQQWLADKGNEVGRLKEARVLERGTSGRVVRLELSGTKGKTVVERELNVRRLFGGLRSGLFVMSYDTDSDGHITTFRFRGAGFGHGVGMCQTGATGMASAGKSYVDILEHYYSGIDVRSLY
jgi:stage II sporulation protein D